MVRRDRPGLWLGGSATVRRIGVCAALVLGSVALLPAAAWSQHGGLPPVPSTPHLPATTLQDRPAPGAASVRLADFRGAVASAEAREVAHWAVHSGDHGAFPFIVIDKVQAQVFVFDNAGVLRGATSALLGTAPGDETVPGIGQRKLSAIRPHERTTPAGRFMAYLNRDIHGEEVLWVDYDSALSLHRMPKGQPKERRAERLASPTPEDNRITYGCINVSVSFYETVVSPLLQKTQGVVYLLPETRPAQVVFGSYSVDGAQPLRAAAPELAAPAGATPVVAAPVAEPVVAEPTRTVSSEGPALAH